ncbi:hypothetical protein GCM10023178_27520 [Actinomadura luteofluorescens]
MITRFRNVSGPSRAVSKTSTIRLPASLIRNIDHNHGSGGRKALRRLEVARSAEPGDRSDTTTTRTGTSAVA